MRDQAQALREEASRAIGVQIEEALYRAQRVLEDVESLVRLKAVRVEDPPSLEALLFAQVVANPRLADALFLRALEILPADERARGRY